MKIKLQENVPYHQALTWQVHDDCYQQEGLRLWAQKHIPYNVTSNATAAWQNAEVVFTLIDQLMPEAETFPILETGAGQGLFAYHFLKAMQAICQREGKDYFPRLRYWLTDYAAKTLAEVAQNPCFAPFCQQGVLAFYLLDVRQPVAAHTLDGRSVPLAQEAFAAVIGNYQHGILPVSILIHRDGEFYEKYVDVYYWLAGLPQEPAALEVEQAILQQLCSQLEKFDFSRCQDGDPLTQVLFKGLDQTFRKALLHLRQELMAESDLADLDIQEYLETLLLEQLELELAQSSPTGAFPHERLQQMIRQSVIQPLLRFDTYPLQRLETIPIYRPIQLETAIPDPAARRVLAAIGQRHPLATVSFPLGSLASLDSLLAVLRPGGILLISDKAHYQEPYLEGLHSENPTLHGNTLSHPVNFPFLSQWLAECSIASLHTRDASCRLQTMLIAKAPALSESLSQIFAAQFIERNLNLECNAQLEAGQQFMQRQEWEQAMACFLEALQHRREDAPALYLLALCYLYQERHAEVLACLKQPHDDFFAAFDFALVQAESHRCLRHWTKAIHFYRQSLARFGDTSLVHYNLAACLEQSGHIEEARLAYQRAYALDPNNEAIQRAWQEVSNIDLLPVLHYNQGESMRAAKDV